jgi:alpha-glucuronidase
MYESLKTCPDDLLLFMHHVPYRYVLHSGKTVIQYFYDSHYLGADEVAGFVDRWRRLEGFVDDERYARIFAALEYQEGHAIVWRDAINSYFLMLSGIPDVKGRAGHFPGRYEAETMTLDGYAPIDVTPWETAGGGRAVSCAGRERCRASFVFDGASGTYDIRVRYFDLNTGASTFTLEAGPGLQPRQLDSWKADGRFPTKDPDGHSSTWRVVHSVALTNGDLITVEGMPDGDEPAPLDYVEVAP